MEEFFDARNVFRHVHAYGVVHDFRNANLPSIFEPPKLLELFDALEFALGQGGIFEEGVALEDVEAEMLQMADLNFAGGVADPGNRRAREIEAIVVEIEDGFYDIGVHDVGGRLDRGGHRGDRGGGLFEKGIDRGVNGRGIEQGLISLDVYEDVALFVGGDFRHALGAGAVVGAGHAGVAAEAFDSFEDAFIVGGDNDAVGASGELRALVDALNHGLASQRNEGLARQTRSSVTRGNDDDDVWVSLAHAIESPTIGNIWAASTVSNRWTDLSSCTVPSLRWGSNITRAPGWRRKDARSRMSSATGFALSSLERVVESQIDRAARPFRVTGTMGVP